MRNGLNLVLLGPPGAGKGVQAAKLASRFQIPHISTGKLLRGEVAAGTADGKAAAGYMARGLLVPDDLVLRLVRHELTQPAAQRGFILDGFPRTVLQAQALELLLSEFNRSLTAVIFLQVPDEVIIDRLAGRLICPDCGAVYHVRYHPPVPGEICPACRTRLRSTSEGLIQCEACTRPIQPREDDRPEVVRTRLKEYHKEVGPLLDYYRSRGLLREIDATGSEGQVFASIVGKCK